MSDKRFLLIMLAINVAFMALIFWPRIDTTLFGPDCDAACLEAADRLIDRHVPELSQTPTPFNPDRFINDALRD